MFKIIKRYYNRRIYTKENVAVFVASGKITKEEFKKITGIEYIG